MYIIGNCSGTKFIGKNLNNVFEQVLSMLTLKDYEDVILSTGGIIKQKKENKWILHTFCHNKNTIDGKPKLEFYLGTKTFYCFSECQKSYNIITLIQQRFKVLGKEKNRFECLQYIVDTCKLNVDLKNFKFKEKNNNKCNWQNCINRYNRYTSKHGDLPNYDKSILNNFQELYHQDWIDYGITINTMEKYNIKWYSYRNQIVIPCYDKNGNLIGIRIRNMNKELLNEGGAKYKPLELLDGSIYNFPTNLTFYGENYNLEEIKRTKVAWIVESEKSVLKFDSWFEEHNVSLALYGSNMGKKRFKDLISLGLNEIVLMLDSDFHTIYDENGELTEEYLKFENKVLKIAKQFKPYINKISVCYNNQNYEGYKYAPCDFTREQFDILYKNREEIF